MVPVMAFNVLVARKAYSAREYSHVAAITLGIVVFNLAKSRKSGGESTAWGIFLLFLSLGKSFFCFFEIFVKGWASVLCYKFVIITHIARERHRGLHCDSVFDGLVASNQRLFNKEFSPSTHQLMVGSDECMWEVMSVCGK